MGKMACMEFFRGFSARMQCVSRIRTPGAPVLVRDLLSPVRGTKKCTRYSKLFLPFPIQSQQEDTIF